MILLANSEAWPGFDQTVELLKNNAYGVDAMVAGISAVERNVKVRSVGYGGWPNMLGKMECDAGVMDGTTREVGSVGAVPDTLPVAALAHEVMKRLPHVMLTGEGARRFATEIGFPVDDVLYEDSKRVWWDRLQKELLPDELKAFPDIPLAPLSRTITDPERVRDTTVFLAQIPPWASTQLPPRRAGHGNIRAELAIPPLPVPGFTLTAATAPLLAHTQAK